MRGQRVGKDFDFPPDIGALIESPGFLPNEDAYHTLAHLWSMRGKPDYVQIEKTLHMVGLSDVAKKKVGNFSLGMRQRLGIAQAIMCNPSLLILDEPFNGLDKQGVQKINNVLLDMNKNGCTIILTSQSISSPKPFPLFLSTAFFLFYYLMLLYVRSGQRYWQCSGSRKVILKCSSVKTEKMNLER